MFTLGTLIHVLIQEFLSLCLEEHWQRLKFIKKKLNAHKIKNKNYINLYVCIQDISTYVIHAPLPLPQSTILESIERKKQHRS